MGQVVAVVLYGVPVKAIPNLFGGDGILEQAEEALGWDGAPRAPDSGHLVGFVVVGAGLDGDTKEQIKDFPLTDLGSVYGDRLTVAIAKWAAFAAWCGEKLPEPALWLTCDEVA